MAQYEMWKANMDMKTFEDFINDLYFSPIVPVAGFFNDGRFHLRKDQEARNFHKNSLTESNPWDYFIGNGIDPGKTTYSFYIYLSTKQSKYKDTKIKYLRKWGFELFDTIEATKEILIRR